MEPIKEYLRWALYACGYAVRHVRHGVGGIDLLHDADMLLGRKSDPLLFDVGANVGQTTLAMLHAFATPRIRAFEPSPATAATLRRAVAHRSEVVVESLALGDVVGTLPFHVTRDYSVNDSLLRPYSDDGGSVVEVPVETVDSYCAQHGLDVIDLLKIDAQGYDVHVLRGARGLLERRQIRLYCCEANFENLYDGQATLREILAFADEVGYRLVGFYQQTYANDRLSYLDALFRIRD
jgi:FkbM family methyltransferase